MVDSLHEALSCLQAIDDVRRADEFALRAVWYIHAEGCLERVVFTFGTIFLSVAANDDDDTVKVWTSGRADFDTAQASDVTQSRPWSSFVGKSLGWGWVTVNQQGYCDGMMLSFAGIQPQVCLNVVASSVKVSEINRIPGQP
jgi:hypothetical protein